MKILTKGHKYGLPGFENPKHHQIIQFIEKEQHTDDPKGECVTVNDGTTTEAVLEMLINRNKYLQDQLPSRENNLAIIKMEEALMWLNKRTADRENRCV